VRRCRTSQARLGHESITTTIDTYGHLLPAGDELISGIIDTALSGGMISAEGRQLKAGRDAAPLAAISTGSGTLRSGEGGVAWIERL